MITPQQLAHDLGMDPRDPLVLHTLTTLARNINASDEREQERVRERRALGDAHGPFGAVRPPPQLR